MKASVAADLFESPDAAGSPIGRLTAGAVVPSMGKSGDFVKVNLGNQRFAFARA
ncbi:MAG: hypothetical protein U0235_31720 [Polyangiaceae bacterium]